MIARIMRWRFVVYPGEEATPIDKDTHAIPLRELAAFLAEPS